MTRVTANGYFDAEDSEQVRFEKRKALNTQRTEDYKNGAYALAGGVRVLRRHLPEGAFDDGRGIIANAQFRKENFLPRAGSKKILIPAPLPDASPRPQQRYHRSGGSWSWACRSGDRLEEARSGLSYLPVA